MREAYPREFYQVARFMIAEDLVESLFKSEKMSRFFGTIARIFTPKLLIDILSDNIDDELVDYGKKPSISNESEPHTSIPL